ncbi:MAG: hypothetical protein CL969_05925 [Euryarchaeota archaeon]|nr:hypothetical protein [Euryarchaeota archaeon]
MANPVYKINKIKDTATIIMDFSTFDFIRIAVGLGVLMYVGNCMFNQKVWIRKNFSWGTREEYPKIFMLNIIGGTLIGVWMVAAPFLW